MHLFFTISSCYPKCQMCCDQKPVLSECSDQLDSCDQGLTSALQYRKAPWFIICYLLIIYRDYRKAPCWTIICFIWSCFGLRLCIRWSPIMVLMMILSLVMFCQNCEAVRSDLVGRVAIVSNPGTKSHIVLISIFTPEFKIFQLLRIMKTCHSQQPRWRLHQRLEVLQPCCPSTKYKVFLCLKMLQLYIWKCYKCTYARFLNAV